MIQLHSQALVVCHPDGRMEPLDLCSIMRALLIQAKAPIDSIEPWIFEQMIDSIVSYFRRDLETGTVPFSQILELTQHLIEDFMNDRLGRSGEIDLFEVAHHAGDAAFELDFYSEVKRLLVERAMPPKEEESKSMPLRIIGLRRCAKFLAGRRRWSKRSSEVRDEILSYIREEVAKVKPENLALVVLS